MAHQPNYHILPALTLPRLPSPILLIILSLLVWVPFSHSLSAAPMKYRFQPQAKDYDSMTVTSLHRYAVKGLSGDPLPSATLVGGVDGTFEDDRRYALLYDDNKAGGFDEGNPRWLHKENFLCAFTASELLASLDTEYRVVRRLGAVAGDGARRLLTAWDRALGRSSVPLLGPVDLSVPEGREEASRFFTELCGKSVRCVAAGSGGPGLPDRHSHQFGNTSSGVKNNGGDTRTVHIINESTVRQLSDAAFGTPDGAAGLTATRFRPNVVVDGLEPWAEFDLVGRTVEVVPRGGRDDTSCRLLLRIVSRTVRCAGVGADPLRPGQGTLDVPGLLVEHFPEHGPYLGVYAVVADECGGMISVGDKLRVKKG